MLCLVKQMKFNNTLTWGKKTEVSLQEYSKPSMNISAPRALVSFESDSGSQEDDVNLAEKLTTSITV